MFTNILIVCVGNICRSPMAEAILRQALGGEQGGHQISSAGLGALVGEPADPIAIELLAEAGINLEDHRARQIDDSMIHDADLILVMEADQKRAIEQATPSAKGKVFRLGEWGDFDIPDPYRQDRPAFQQALNLIQQGATQWQKKLQP